MAAKSSKSARKTVVFTRRSSVVPASARIAARFAKTCSVCSSIDPVSSPWSGLRPIWPETNTKSPALIACEYGAPWNGAGAFSVRTTDLASLAIRLLSSTGATALRQRDPEPLEDRLEDVLRVSALDQADVQGQARSLRELGEKARDEIGGEPTDTHVRKVDVGDDQRPVRHFEHDMRQRLIGGDDGRTVAAHTRGMERIREGLSERPACGRHLRVRLLGRDLERQIEGRMLGEQGEQVVEHRDSGVHVGLARAVDVDARLQAPLLFRVAGPRHPSTQGIAAPAAHR